MEVAYDGLEHRLRRLLAVMSPNRSTSHCTNLSGFTEREESVPKLDCRSEMASLLGRRKRGVFELFQFFFNC